MSYNFEGIQPPVRVDPPTPIAQPVRAPSPSAPTSTDAVTVDTFPASPPHEVMAEIHAAAGAADRLAAANRELQFRTDPTTGHLQVEVRDLHGNLLFIAPPSTALAVAGGASLSG